MFEVKKKVLDGLVAALVERGAKTIRLFGSQARGTQKRGSDIDVIVEFRDQKSLLDLARIEREVSREIGSKIDLLTENALSPHLAKTIARESKVLYA